MLHPKEIGDRSTVAIMHALRDLGYAIYLPFGENTRSDLIIDTGLRVSRVQCKTGRLRNGAVVFATCSTYGHHAKPKVLKRDYQGEVDEFAVYCPELGTVYLIPIEDVPVHTAATLRVAPARNSQVKNVRLAAAYEIARFEIV